MVVRLIWCGKSDSSRGTIARLCLSAVAMKARQCSAVVGIWSIARRGAAARFEIDRRSCGLTVVGGARVLAGTARAVRVWLAAASSMAVSSKLLVAAFGRDHGQKTAVHAMAQAAANAGKIRERRDEGGAVSRTRRPRGAA